MTILVSPLIALLVMLAKARLQAIVTIIFMAIFWTIITGFNSTVTEKFLPTELDKSHGTITYPYNMYFGGGIKSTALLFVGYVTVFVLLLILLSVAPAKAITRRLIFLALGPSY